MEFGDSQFEPVFRTGIRVLSYDGMQQSSEVSFRAIELLCQKNDLSCKLSVNRERLFINDDVALTSACQRRTKAELTSTDQIRCRVVLVDSKVRH
jgi:hypothetical protein